MILPKRLVRASLLAAALLILILAALYWPRASESPKRTASPAATPPPSIQAQVAAPLLRAPQNPRAAGFGAIQPPKPLAARTPGTTPEPAHHEHNRRAANFDIRPPREGLPTATQERAVEALRQRIPSVRVQFDGVTGAPSHIQATGEFLTPTAAPGTTARATLQTFVQQNAELFGHGAAALEKTRTTREDVTEHNGMTTLVLQQELDGIPLYKTILQANVSKDGRLITTGSHFVPDPETAAPQPSPQRTALSAAPPIDAPKAIALAAANLGVDLAGPPAHPSTAPEGAERRMRFEATGLSDLSAGLTWLPLSATSLRLGWDITLNSRQGGYRMVVDAQTGDVLVRTSLTNDLSNASYRVYADATSFQPFDSPTPFSPGYSTPQSAQPAAATRNLVTLSAQNTTASPNGWIDDGGTQTLGNNVDAHLDLADADPAYGDGTVTRAVSATRTFDFALDLAQAPSTYQSASLTSLFYAVNWYHDRVYSLGFTESAGNFQQNNFSRGGLGNDAVVADGQDGGGTNNANFFTPPDGQNGRMQMYLFDGPTPDRDGSLDMEVVLHEATHGLSNRLVGGGVGIDAMQPSGMGEGWSDFYALSLLSDPADAVNGNYAEGGYATYQLAGLTTNYYSGIRRYPYSTDLTKSPLTLKDVDPLVASLHGGVPISPIFNFGNTTHNAEVHNQGEVWCAALWEVRAAMITKYGGAAGNTLTLLMVTDAMKLSPVNPTFLQARDSILQADLVDNAAANKDEIWAAFAKRGFGAGAQVPPTYTSRGVVENFATPAQLPLLISQNAPLAWNGRPGGSITPGSYGFVLQNTSAAPLSWTAAKTQPWLNLSATSGTLLPGASTSIIATLAAGAGALPGGGYSDTITFTNTTAGTTQTRSAILELTQIISEADPGLGTGQWSSAALVSGRPAICYYDALNGDLKYVRANDALGTSWGTPVTLASTGDVGSYTSMVIVSGNPAVCYQDTTNLDVKFVRANDATGSTWGTPVTVVSSGVVGYFNSMQIVSGNPAIAYYDNTLGVVRYVRAANATGSAWGTPVTAAANPGYFPSLAVVNGDPAIAYYDASAKRLKYVRSADTLGASWGSILTVDNTGDSVGYYACLAVVNGNPAISYADVSTASLRYVRATDVNGASWNTPLDLDLDNDTIFDLRGRISLLPIGGKPAIAYLDATTFTLRYLRANDASGTSWPAPRFLDRSSLSGFEPSMIDLNGRAGISYFDNTSATLKFILDSALLINSVTPPANGLYGVGQPLDVTLTFNQAVTVTGATSTLALTIGANSRSAAFLSKTAFSITYRYIVQVGETDADGIALGALTLNTTTITDVDGNPASLGFTAPGTAGVLVDGVAPGVTVTPNGTLTNVSPINFNIAFTENVNNLAAAGITVTNGTKGTLTGSGASYQIPVTPTGQGPVTCQVMAGAATDAANNPNTVSNTASVTYDTTPPAVTNVVGSPGTELEFAL